MTVSKPVKHAGMNGWAAKATSRPDEGVCRRSVCVLQRRRSQEAFRAGLRNADGYGSLCGGDW